MQLESHQGICICNNFHTSHKLTFNNLNCDESKPCHEKNGTVIDNSPDSSMKYYPGWLLARPNHDSVLVVQFLQVESQAETASVGNPTACQRVGHAAATYPVEEYAKRDLSGLHPTDAATETQNQQITQHSNGTHKSQTVAYNGHTQPKQNRRTLNPAATDFIVNSTIIIQDLHWAVSKPAATGTVAHWVVGCFHHFATFSVI